MKAILLILTMCLMLNPHVSAHVFCQDDSVLEGTIVTRYMISDPDEMLVPVSVNAPGYRQTVEYIQNGYIITVSIDVYPVVLLQSFAFNDVMLPGVFHDSTLVNGLASAETVTEALRVCLAWLDQTIKYQDETEKTQDFDAIIKRKTGNCVGRSNVLTTLLNSLGIQTRTVQGALYKTDSLYFHRWIEISYADTGYLPSEPGVTQDFVLTDHLTILPSKHMNPDVNNLADANVTISVISHQDTSWIIDCMPKPEGFRSPIKRRQTSSRQYVTALTGEISPVGLPAVVQLQSGNTTQTINTHESNVFSFLPVLPGAYRLTVSVYEQEGFRRSGYLQAGEREHVSCTLKIRQTKGVE